MVQAFRANGPLGFPADTGAQPGSSGMECMDMTVEDKSVHNTGGRGKSQPPTAKRPRLSKETMEEYADLSEEYTTKLKTLKDKGKSFIVHNIAREGSASEPSIEDGSQSDEVSHCSEGEVENSVQSLVLKSA